MKWCVSKETNSTFDKYYNCMIACVTDLIFFDPQVKNKT
jgi:hypothetical protein